MEERRKEERDELRIHALAIGKNAAEGAPYIQLKSVEAIGRLRIAGSEDLLADLVSHRTLIGFSLRGHLELLVFEQAFHQLHPGIVLVGILDSGTRHCALHCCRDFAQTENSQIKLSLDVICYCVSER